MSFSNYSLNLNGRLLNLSSPAVMAIVNATPDSFHTSCHTPDEAALAAMKAVEDGAAIIDVGGCSTRPGGDPATEEEEWQRLDASLTAIRRAVPDAAISVDTFRAQVARKAAEKFGVDIINDISGGSDEMFATVAELGVAYVLTHNAGGQYSASPSDNTPCASEADYVASVMRFLEPRVAHLINFGVHDVIVDPGFGFGKTLEQNYALLRNLEVLHELDCPILAGMSHKSMLSTLLGIETAQCGNATAVANTIALMNGADILRVHNTRYAVEAVKVFTKTFNSK